MKWVSHKMATGAILYAVTGNIIITGLGVMGSTFPDFVEGRPPAQGTAAYNNWRKSHRGLSHWLIPYLLIAGGGFYYLNMFGIIGISIEKLIAMLRFWSLNIDILLVHLVSCFALGGVLHILQDAICGRVPLLFPGKKYGIRLFRVGSMTEYTLVFPLSVFLIIWRFAAQYGFLVTWGLPELPSWFVR